MEEPGILWERHEQNIRSLQRQVDVLTQVQSEIKTMNETLVMLTTELKHTNEHLACQEHRIERMENRPKMRLDQIVTAIIAALAGGLISVAVGTVFGRL